METKKQIEKANEILLKGEPSNISYDSYGGYTGYKPQYVIAAMNEAFGVGMWGFKELSMSVTETLAIAQVEVYLKDIESRPTAWGQSRITKGDEGDARKGAQTDAIKKGLSYFGIGERAYFGLLPKPQDVPARAYAPRGEASAPKAVNDPSIVKSCVLCGTKAIKMSAQGNAYCRNGYNGDKKVPGHIVKDKKQDEPVRAVQSYLPVEEDVPLPDIFN